MSYHEYEQAEQLEKYWAILTKAGIGEAPEELDPELAAMSQQLARQFRAPDPEPEFVEKLQQQLVAQAASSAKTNRARLFPLFSGRSLRRELAVGAALALAFVGLCLWMAQPQPAKAQEIIQKAREAATLHASGNVRSFVMTEVRHGTLNDPRLQAELGLKDDAQILSETRRWYEAPNRWRMEFTQKIIAADGKQVKSYATIRVGDGTNDWVFDLDQNKVTVNPIAAGQSSKTEINFFGGDVNGLNHLFEQAGKCFDPKVTGNDTVAGRATFVIDFGPTKCPSASLPAMKGRETIWVDRETFFVLKHELRAKDSNKPLLSSEVTKIEHNVAIAPARFIFTSPAGSSINDIQPKPAPPANEHQQEQPTQPGGRLDYPPVAPNNLHIGARAVAADGAGGSNISSLAAVSRAAAGGEGMPGFSGDVTPAFVAYLDSPWGIAVDSAGNLYIADKGKHQIRKVTPEGIISMVAGSDTKGFSGDGGPATAARMYRPEGVAVDSKGNLYIADTGNNRIRKLTPEGIISTVAGNGISGYSGDGGPATAAQLSSPYGLAVDSKGNLYIADFADHRIRKVNTAGIISTIAGNGTRGNSGDGGTATAAQLTNPRGVAVDSAGNLHITGTNQIRKVTVAGIISTVAGGGTGDLSDGGSATTAKLSQPNGVAVDSADNLYIADTGNNRIRKVTPAGIISTVAGNGTVGYNGDGGHATMAQLYLPKAVAVDSAGNIYIADSNRIRKVTTAGIISTVAGNRGSGERRPAPSAKLSRPILNGAQAIAQPIDQPSAVAADGTGGFYFSSPSQNRIYRVAADGSISLAAGAGSSGYSGDDGLATAAQLNAPIGMAVDSSGNLYIADSGNGRIRKVTPAGIIITVAGSANPDYVRDGGLAIAAHFDLPISVAVDSAGNLYIADRGNNRIRKVTPEGKISTVAGNGTSGYSGDGGPATEAGLASPHCVAVNSAGNLYIADRGNNRIRKVTAAGIISTVAGGAFSLFADGGLATAAQLNAPIGMAVDSSGNLYIADSANSRIRKVTSAGIISTVAGNGTRGSGGDGGLATAAQLAFGPSGLAVDSAGNLYIADRGNNRIRKVTPAGIISTVAGNGNSPYSDDDGQATAAKLSITTGVAVDSAGNFYIADRDSNRIRKVTTEGVISTVAGNGTIGFSGDGALATAAQLSSPSGVAVDSAGNLYIADYGNLRIRKVTTEGIISTVAGRGFGGLLGDGGPATAAQVNYPNGVALDSEGNLYIAENNRIRKVTAAGIISTMAGTGTQGYNGDEVPAIAAQLYSPRGLAVDSVGNLYFADRGNHRIRKVATTGIITTVAGGGTAELGDGGLATAAKLKLPTGVAFDSKGSLYITEAGHNLIRKVTPSGKIITVAGKEGRPAFKGGYSGDGTPATEAEIKNPQGLAFDSAGNLFIVDAGNHRIRKITPAGIISTVAGNGN
jgi:sugar lactone lactonase YvrE/outer membrane lipoprotein-sorting protein